MRRRIIMLVSGTLAAVLGVGLLVVASQQGWFGGKAKRLLVSAHHAAAQGQLVQAQQHLETLIATFPDSPWVDDALLALGEVYEGQQKLAEAQGAYRTVVDQFPDSPLAAQAQTRLGNVNIALLFSPVVTDLDAVHEVKPGDTLGKIAAAYATTIDCIKRANGLKSDVIQPGQKLKVPKGKFSIVVDKSQNQLLLTENNQFLKTYRVATGKNNSTPVGTFKVVNKIANPVWYTEGAVVPPDSPKNILGTRWLGLDIKGYGIHGSVDPDAMGQQVTAGCVRMRNNDVEELFAIVSVGTEVTIVD